MNRSTVSLWCRALAAVVTGISGLSAQAEETQIGKVCRKDFIEGHKEEASNAEKILSKPPTSDPSKCQIYVTRSGNGLYAHSNFVTPGVSADGRPFEPSKMTVIKRISLLSVTENLIGSPMVGLGLFQAHERQVEFLIDQNLIDGSGSLDVDPAGAKNLWLLPGGKRPPMRMRGIDSIRGPPYIMAVECRPNVYVRIRNTGDPNRLFRRLERRSLKPTEIVFASFVVDTKVTESIDKTSRVKRANRTPKRLTREALEELLARNKGKVVVILAHTRNGNFYAEIPGKDGQPKTVIEIPIKEMVASADRGGCELCFIGCGSGSKGAPFGPLSEVNPVEAITILEEAFGATTRAGFCEKFAASKIPYGIEEGAFGTNKSWDLSLWFGEESHSRSRVTVEAEVRPQLAEGYLEGVAAIGFLVISFTGEEDDWLPTWAYVAAGITATGFAVYILRRRGKRDDANGTRVKTAPPHPPSSTISGQKMTPEEIAFFVSEVNRICPPKKQ